MEIKTIGRGIDNDIQIDKPDISEHHLKISRIEENYFLIEDLKSSNHTFVNGHPVRRAHVSTNDEIRLSKDTYLELDKIFGNIPSIPVPLNTIYTDGFYNLKAVWENAQKKRKDITKKYQRKSGFIRLVIMLGIIGVGFCFKSFIGEYFIVISVVAGAIASAFVPNGSGEELRQLNEDLQRSFKCPECSKSLGTQFSWDYYAQEGKCPHCQKSFKKNNM
ncbi:MAG: FHA domain-containing protein [Dysgonamonadaceae bacterium]|nr:FHA domain-containing protein [Dysgonamonadaceae bacterium]